MQLVQSTVQLVYVISTKAIKVEALLEAQALCKAFPQESLPIHVY